MLLLSECPCDWVLKEVIAEWMRREEAKERGSPSPTFYLTVIKYTCTFKTILTSHLDYNVHYWKLTSSLLLGYLVEEKRLAQRNWPWATVWLHAKLGGLSQCGWYLCGYQYTGIVVYYQMWVSSGSQEGSAEKWVSWFDLMKGDNHGQENTKEEGRRKKDRCGSVGRLSQILTPAEDLVWERGKMRLDE